MVSSGVVASTITIWNLLAKAPSFSIYSRYSSKVVAPTHWISPRARAGLNILEASNDPEAPPAPTIVCNSSMNMITSGDFSISVMTAFILSSNCPLYFVPATNEARSRVTTRFPNNTRDTFFWTILKAKPSAMAVLPTPGSPINMGLFFFLRLRIWATRSISFSRPTMGSILSSSANFVKSLPKLSNTGVLVFSPPLAEDSPLPLPGVAPAPNIFPPSSSGSSVSDSAMGFSVWYSSISLTTS